jgi:hypothetical protein
MLHWSKELEGDLAAFFSDAKPVAELAKSRLIHKMTRVGLGGILLALRAFVV